MFLFPLRHGRFNISISRYETGMDDYPVNEYAIAYGKHYKSIASNGYKNHKSGYWVCRKHFYIRLPVFYLPEWWYMNHPARYDCLHFDEEGNYVDAPWNRPDYKTPRKSD